MMNDQSNCRTTNIHSGTMRQRLLSGGAMALCLATLIAHGSADAANQPPPPQAFQGTPTVVSGGATIIQTAPLDTITVTTPQAVINWKPNDTSGTGTIDFLPVGLSARFTGSTDFTVLNRIIPVDGSDVPIARMIALNGTITSDLFGSQPGGNVWFYSPGGILVGSTGVINVGSLVLTSRDIDTTGGLFGTSGEIRFRDPALTGTATSQVEIASGASITAFNGTAGGSYIALVAPHIVQAGTVSVDGSVALVAAEQADIRINNGLFDITILAGSSDANGIVHSGTTGGPSGAGNRAYFVAVPKNQAMTMLLSGTIGFETASAATLSEGGIILSAGHNIVGGVLSDSVNGNSTGSIQISDTIFLNTLNGAATDGITGRPSTSCAPSCSATSTAGQIQFRKDATLSAFNDVDLSVGQAQRIIAGGNLTLIAERNGIGGVVGLRVDNTPPPSAGTTGGGLVTVAGQLLLDASGHGFSPDGGIGNGGRAEISVTAGQLTATSILARANGFGTNVDGGPGANGIGGTAAVAAAQGGSITTSSLTVEAIGTSTALVATAGSGVGGSASVGATGDGAIAITNALTISALGLGQIGSDTSGQGTGGFASLDIKSATSSISAGSTSIDASGFGGGILDQLANPLTPNTLIGGNGTGGTATLNSSGTANLGALNMHADGIGGESQPTNNRDTARGGNGQGGTVSLALQSGTLTVPLANLSANGHGGSSGGALGTTGSARGGSISLSSSGGAFQVGVIPLVDGNLTLTANADIDASDGGTVAKASGGTINLNSDFGGRVTVNNQLTAQATAISSGGPFDPPVTASGNATGGTVNLSTTSGSLSADTARIDTSAKTTSATGTAGNALGGNISLSSFSGGALTFNQSSAFDANGIGGNGAIGGTGTGGTMSIRAASGRIKLGGHNFININGIAGMSAPGNAPLTGRGGHFDLEVTDESGTLLNFGEIDAAVNGGSAVPPTGFNGPQAPTNGFGGRATLSFAGPRTDGSRLNVQANGYGVNGGEGHGGFIDFFQTAGTTNISFTALNVDGFGGDGLAGANAGQGGAGVGGLLNTSFTGGFFDGDELFLSSRGTGGTGNGGCVTGFPAVAPGNGGVGTGGLITILIGGPTDGTAQVSIATGLTADAGAEGGAGGDMLFLSPPYFTPGDGGTAQGGEVHLTHSGNQLSDGSDSPANINLSAPALGGIGGGLNYDGPMLPTDTADRPDGGDALGGTVDVLVQTRTDSEDGGSYTLDSGATGGDGGSSLTGGKGGNGAGGTSRFTLDNVDVGLVAVTFSSEGRGGNGADGINGAGGSGGVGSGGTASALVNGAGGALVLIGSGFQTNGTGGRGGDAFVDQDTAIIPVIGPDGGQGGEGIGGTIALEANDGTLTLAESIDGGLFLTSQGFGGAGGNGADNSAGPAGTARTGGNAGFGGFGTGGSVTLRANGGTIASDVNAPSLTIDVTAVGGAGASGGAGNAVSTTDPVTGLPVTSGGPGFGTGQSSDQAGLIRLEANDSVIGVGLIRFSNATLLASGTDFAGRIELIDNATGAGLMFNSLTAESIGPAIVSADFTTGGSGIYINSRDGTIRVDGDARLETDGTIQLDATGTGGLDVGQGLTTLSRDLIARHTGRSANQSTISANNIFSSAFNGGIDFQLGTLVSALGILDLQGDFVHFGRLASGNLSRIRAISNITGNQVDADSVDFASSNGNIAVDTINAGNGIILTALNGLVSGGTATSQFAGIEIDARDVDYDQLFAAETIDIAASGNVILDFAQTEPDNIQNSGLGQSPQANGPSGGADILITAGGNVALSQLIAADRIDINAATLTGANSALSAGDDIEIDTSGNAEFGTLDANDGLVVTSLGAVTGTRATTLIGTAGIALNGANGVNVATVRSRGATALTATNGALEIGTLTSAGLITANARSIVITGSGGLSFAALNATAGDASVIASSGDLSVHRGTITGTATLTTQGGALTVDDLTANRIALTSNTTATITGTVIGTNALNITSTGATIVDGDKATGGVITITSGDIVIDEGQIGTRGTTSAVTLANGDGSVRTYVGGNDQANAYSLSAAEMLQIFGTNVTIRAPLVTAQSGTALGSTRPPDVIIGAFTFNVATASTGNLGAGGTLSIITPGSARVVGAAQLTNMTSSNGFTLQADQGIEVILGQGSIRLTGAGSGALGGVLSLKADDIAVATSNAISDIAIAPDIAAINTRLGRNDGVTSADGALSAATINFDATNGLYIQNSGASDRNNDRRGFTTNALNITSGGTNTRIVINGQIANAAGLFQNGADTIRPTMINGVAAGAGGAFAQGSTINGCLIANPAGCNAVPNFDQNDFIKNQIGTNARRRPTIRRLLMLGLGRSAIHIRDDEPLVDEPITGSGNDDLWIGEPDEE